MSRGLRLTAMAGAVLFAPFALFAAAPLVAAAATAAPTTTLGASDTSTTTTLPPTTPPTTSSSAPSSTPITALVNDPFAPVPPGGAATTASVSIVDFAFSPATITVSAGTTVTWSNTGTAPHSVTSDTGAFDSSPSCPTGQCIDPGSSYSHLFSQSGTFAYHCKVHSNMTGTVVVNAAPAPSTTTTTTTATPGSSTPSNNTTPPVSSGGTPGSTASPNSSGGPELAFTGASSFELWLALGGLAAITLGLALRPRRRSFPDPS